MVLFPVLLMLFSLAMEQVEGKLSKLAVREHDVEEFLDQASSSDVATLANDGFPNALAKLNNRKSRPQVAKDSEALLDQRAS